MNANMKWIAVVIAAVVVGATLGYGFAHRESKDATQPAESGSGSAPAGGERKVLYWHDPMVPGAKFDKPGKSPFMDMQLVPVYADEAGDSGVRISPTEIGRAHV